MLKISEDKKRDIKPLPLKVIPSKEAQRLFGIPELIFTYHWFCDMYLLKENSGIIRSGFTGDFYKNYKQYFTEYDSSNARLQDAHR